MSRRTSLIVAGTIAVLWLGAPTVRAADNARQILTEYENRYRSRSQEHTGDVVVTTKKGTERRKTWKSYREGNAGSANRLIRFLSPPEVRGVGFLSRGRPGRDPEQWLYLPSMKRERRIAAQDRDTPFVGTDFSYEDLDEFDQSRFDASLLADQNIGGFTCYMIQLTPIDRSVYERLVVAIRKDNMWMLRIDYFARGERSMSKQLVFSRFSDIDGRSVALELVMTDFRRGSHTKITLTEVAFDRPQPTDRYTLKNLVREGGDAVRMVPGDTLASSLRRAPGPSPLGFGSQDSPASSPAIPRPTGYVDATTFGFLRETGRPEPNASFWGTVVLNEALKVGKVRVSSSVRAELIPSTDRGPLAWDLADRQTHRSPLSVRELSVLVPLTSAIDLQAGRFVIDVSRTDVYSPADAFLPRDLTDLFSPEKLPLWGARLQAERGRYRLELYDAFVTTPWRLPRMDGRYSPFAYSSVYLLDARSPPPRSGFVFGRIQRTGDTWDVGIWGRSGIRPVPLLSGDLDNVEQEGDLRFVQLERRYVKEHGAGLQVSRELGSWMLRGELAQLVSPDPDLKNAFLWTVEAQRSFRSGVLTVTGAGNILESPQTSVLFFDRAFLPGFLVGTEQKERWGRWTVSWLGTIQKIGGLFKAEISKDLSDTVKVTLGADLPDGARIESPGAFGKGQRVRAALRWSW